MIDEIYADRKGEPPGCIVLSVGGGGLLSGVCTGLKRVGWGAVPVYACQSERCALLDAVRGRGRGRGRNRDRVRVRGGVS